MSFTKKLAQYIADWLVSGGGIQQTDREVYEYGLDKLLSTLICLLITLTMGLYLGILAPAVLFFLTYYTMRIYAGGYHADTPLRCFFISTILIVSPLLLIYTHLWWYSWISMAVCLLVAGVVLFFIAPVDNAKKRIDESERRVYRQRMMICLVIASVLLIVLKGAGASVYSAATLCGILLSAGLAAAGKVKDAIIAGRTA